MPKLTENYGFKKPLGTESTLISVLNENFDAIDEALTPPLTTQSHQKDRLFKYQL